MRIAIRIGLCVYAATFIVGGAIVGKAFIENRQADNAYSEIRQQTQENAYVYSVSADALTVPVGAPVSVPASAPVNEATEQPQPPVVRKEKTSMDFAPLKEINPEIVAWLKSEGAAIDYPVLRGEDNDYYLSRLYTGERNSTGSLFADYRNTGLFTDKNTVIYGHNLKSGAMFHSLGEYKAQDYYDARPTMELYTPDGDYVIELFSGTVEDGDYEFVQFDFAGDEAFMEYIAGVRSRSTFQSDVVVDPADRIVTLCTCSYEHNNARYVVMGKLTPVMQQRA